MNEEEAADYLGVSIQKLREYVADGKINPVYARSKPDPRIIESKPVEHDNKIGVYSKSEPSKKLDLPPQEIFFNVDDLRRLKEELRAEQEGMN